MKRATLIRLAAANLHAVIALRATKAPIDATKRMSWLHAGVGKLFARLSQKQTNLQGGQDPIARLALLESVNLRLTGMPGDKEQFGKRELEKHVPKLYDAYSRLFTGNFVDIAAQVLS